MKKMKHMMERVWTYLCVCMPNVLVCGIFGCELSLSVCGSCASSYNILSSLQMLTMSIAKNSELSDRF